MKNYSVKMPVCGYVWVDVEAESEKDAINKAYSAEWCADDLEELDMYDKICEGNICYVSNNKAEVCENDMYED